MGLRLLLLLVILIGLMAWLGWYAKAEPEARNRSLKNLMLYGVAGALILLVLTGRVHWIYAAIGAAIPWLNRGAAALRAWHLFKSAAQPGQASADEKPRGGEQQQSSSSGTLAGDSAQEAIELLGLQPDYSRQDVIDAHRRLIQKLHPDRGGSDYLSSRINRAREILLAKL